MGVSQPDQGSGKRDQAAIIACPVHANILCIGIVIAVLAVRQFAGHRQHRGAAGQQQGGQQVALVPQSGRIDIAVRCCALHTMVPAMIGAGAIAVLLAIGLIMLVLEGGEVGERETIMRGDEVDPARGAMFCAKYFGRTGEPRCQRAEHTAIPAPEAADVIAVLVVPFPPAAGEIAGLIAAGANIPWLGNQLQPAQQRVLGNGRQQRRGGIKAGIAARQCGREIKAEAIQPRPLRPCAQ